MGAMKDERHLKWINRTLGGAFVAAGVALQASGARR
jgi:threonine/homoserine/homoserine lactone efflux protein